MGSAANFLPSKTFMALIEWRKNGEGVLTLPRRMRRVFPIPPSHFYAIHIVIMKKIKLPFYYSIPTPPLGGGGLLLKR